MRTTSWAVLAAIMTVVGCGAASPSAAPSAKERQPGGEVAKPAAPAPRVEVSLSGYQSVLQPERRADRLGQEYMLPSDRTLAYFKAKGVHVFRLPMLWERLQPQPGKPLDAAKVKELRAYLDHADRLGVRFIADLHAFGRHRDQVLGSPQLPISALVSFWEQFARAFAGRFEGYDIMNEPHDMPSPAVWPRAAQLTVDAIRKVDRTTTLYIEGDYWSNAQKWPEVNGALDIRDPAGRLIYSAHQYFDFDSSGQYHKDYASDGADPEIGGRRVRPFIAWLRSRKARGHLGEFGIPTDDRAWLPVLDRFLDEAFRGGDVLTGVTYWMAGDWADNYKLTLQPAKGDRWIDRPQTAILLKRRPTSPAPAAR